MTTDLWSEASRDLDVERHDLALETAKAASTGTWAFLAMAGSQAEFEDRLALADERIRTVASESGADPEELVSVFAQRFALLAEAGSLSDFPHGGKDDDSDDEDDSDDSSDDSSDDDSDSDDSDDSGDDDGDDSDDDSSSSDDDSDSDDSGNDSDDDKDSAPPWANKFSSLASRIAAGENPMAWGGTPFVRSSARKEAADGAPVSDVNSPTPDPLGGMGAPAPVPGMEGGIAETTKPRQMPESGGMDSPGMGMDGIDPGTGGDTPDPGLNGGDINQGADDLPPSTAKIAAIAAEVRRYNPNLSDRQVQHVASQAYATYLHKHAEDMSPLLFGDRGGVGDGPATNKVKTWAPADFRPGSSSAPASGTEDGGDSGGSGEEGGGHGIPPVIPGLKRMLPSGGSGAAAGEAAGAAGIGAEVGEAAAAARMLPLLAL